MKYPEYYTVPPKMERSILPPPLVPLPTNSLSFDGRNLDFFHI